MQKSTLIKKYLFTLIIEVSVIFFNVGTEFYRTYSKYKNTETEPSCVYLYSFSIYFFNYYPRCSIIVAFPFSHEFFAKNISLLKKNILLKRRRKISLFLYQSKQILF